MGIESQQRLIYIDIEVAEEAEVQVLDLWWIGTSCLMFDKYLMEMEAKRSKTDINAIDNQSGTPHVFASECGGCTL